MRLSIPRFGFALGCTLLAFSFLFNPAATQAEPVMMGIVHRVDYAYAKMMKHAFEMALEQINAAGGIKGRPLEVSYADDRGEPNAGVEAVKALIRHDKAVMLVGAYSSSNALQMAFSADRLDTPFLVCTAADDHITQPRAGCDIDFTVLACAFRLLRQQLVVSVDARLALSLLCLGRHVQPFELAG